MTPTIRQLAIDGSFVARRAFESGTMASGFLGTVAKLQDEFHPEMTVACWEGGGTPFRTMLLPTYKGQRHAKHEAWERKTEWARDLADLKSHLPLVGVYQCCAKGYEADDCLATIARTWPGNTLIFSPDHDMLPLLGTPSVYLKQPDKPLLGPHNFTPVDAARALDVATLAGCPGDEVPGLRIGVYQSGKKKGEPRHMRDGLAAKVLDAMPNAVERMIALDNAAVEVEAKKHKGQVADLLRIVSISMAHIALNRALVSLYTVGLEFTPPREDPRELAAWSRARGCAFLVSQHWGQPCPAKEN